MFEHKRLLGIFVVVLCALVFLSPSSLSAQDKKDDNAAASDQRERAMKAAEVLTEVMGIAEQGIPDELMEHSVAVAVIPNVIKGALGIGGQHGKGLVSHRGPDGRWSAPSYIDLSGGSIGLQLGVESSDLVLVFTDNSGFKGLLDGKVKLGADAGVAAGPVGRKAQVGTDVLLKSPIFSYSRSKGLFAGVSLDGVAVTIDDSGNRKAYGREVTAQDILLNNKVQTSDVVAPFVRALEKYAPPTKHTPPKSDSRLSSW
jgi:lipid-binding SYLF domain-containing protein